MPTGPHPPLSTLLLDSARTASSLEELLAPLLDHVAREGGELDLCDPEAPEALRLGERVALRGRLSPELQSLAELAVCTWEARNPEKLPPCRLPGVSSFWRELLDLSVDVIFLVDAQRGILYASPAAEAVFGYAPEELERPEAGRRMLHPDSLAAYQAFGEYFAKKGVFPEHVQEWAWIHRSGRRVYTENLYRNLRDESGKVTGFLTIARDVTERKEWEQRDRYRQLQRRQAEENSRVMVGVLDPAGRWRQFPARLAQLLGCGLEVETWADLVVAADRENAQARLKEAVVTRQAVEVEARYSRADGGISIIAISFSPMKTPQGEVESLLVHLRDHTENRRNELANREAQKLESMGLLAGGIAHDFNNLLTAILGNVTLALLEDPPAPILNPLLNVEKAGQRAAELTRQMLAYSGKGRFVVAPVDLNRLLQEMALLLSVSISKNIRLHQDLSPSIPTVSADEAQIQQVILALVTNASEAIGEESGVIAVRTRVVRLSQADAELSVPACPVRPGMHVAVTVFDSGEGMSAQLQERIFDPFFSTRGKGRGLGLSAVLGILRGHKAGLAVRSAPGDGSEFTLYFPLKPASNVSSSARSAPNPGTDPSRILVVDDEVAIRSVARRMLEALGFRVAEAADGEEAMQKLRSSSFDLVLLDLTMPRKDGRETLIAMGEAGITTPVVLCSGYDEHEVNRMLSSPTEGFLQKPYRIQELEQVVRNALGRGRTPTLS
jgi:two-component system, cell cycle sensor histidine kinase and response regulator CckA